MKKQQKIIELRTAAELKVSEIETKIALAYAAVADIRAGLMRLRADALENAETETERFNVIANYRAILADTQAKHSAKVAMLKYEIQQTKAECRQQCAAAEDDPEPEEEQPRQTVYCDGSENSARIAARRLINKLPHIPEDGSISVMISRGGGDLRDCYWFSSCTTNGTHLADGMTYKMFDESNHDANSEAEYVNLVRASFDARKDGDNE